MAKHRLFKGIDRTAIEKMASFAGARRRQLAKDEVALHKGDRLRHLVVVLSGRVNIVQQLRDGTELLDYTVKAGGVVGVTFLMPRADSFPSMIQAAEPSEIVLLDAGKMRELMKMPENSRLRENVYQAIVTVLCECHRKLSVVGCWEICDKVLTYLEHLSADTGSSEVEIPFRTSSEFAQYLGVNRCALSRSVSQLIRSGKLGVGTYYLVETQTPRGYDTLPGPVKITVTDTNGILTMTAEIAGEYVGADKLEKIDNGLWKLSVQNSAGYELPNTGGRGTNLFTLFGIILTAIAGAGLIMRNCRKAAKIN